MTPPTVSFVLVTYNRLLCLERAITSVRNCCLQVNEIIVVDNASTDGTREWLLQQEDIKGLFSAENIGPGPGRNLGIAAAKGDFVFFLDDDAYLVEDVVSPGLELLKSSSDIGCVAYPIWEDTLAQIIYGRHPGQVKCFAAGGALFVKQALFDAGLFDEESLWAEEFDLSIKLYACGYRIVALEAPIIHHLAVTSIVQHSTLKLRRIAYARWRTLLTHFRFTTAFIMCSRVAVSLGVAGLRSHSLLPLPLALWDILRAANKILANRNIVSREVEAMFFRPDHQEDEFSVPLMHKLNSFLMGQSLKK